MRVSNFIGFSSFSKLYRIFNPRQRKTFVWLAMLTFISSIADLAGLLLIVPVVKLVLAPASYNSIIHTVPFLANFSKENLLLLCVALFFLLVVSKNAFGLLVN